MKYEYGVKDSIKETLLCRKPTPLTNARVGQSRITWNIKLQNEEKKKQLTNTSSIHDV